jgi:outer membrane protein assembly factor BamB
LARTSKPGFAIQWILGLTGALALLGGWSLWPAPGNGTLRVLFIVSGVCWLGAIDAIWLRLAPPGLKPRQVMPGPESIMLWALAAGFGLLAAMPVTSSPASARVAWTFEPIGRGAIISSPEITDDRVYVGAIEETNLSSRGVVYCLDRRTGKPIWHFDDGGALQHMYSSPCVAQGRLYVGEGMHANQACKLYCLDAETGKKLWSFPTTSHIESTPCVAEGQVFFGAGDDGVYCLDAATGAKHWQGAIGLHVDASPIVQEHSLYIGSVPSRADRLRGLEQKGFAFCLDAGNGRTIWKTATTLPVTGSPAIVGDHVYFGLGNGKLLARAAERPAGALLCLESATGKTAWQLDVPDAVFARPTLDGERAYFGARDGCLYAADQKTGHLVWKHDLKSAVLTQVALSGPELYVVATGGSVAKLEAKSGNMDWTFDVASYSRTSPQLLSSPAVWVDSKDQHNARWIYFGAELRNPVTSAATVYGLRD